ncbi:MAG: ATP-dependent DNA helicase RecG [Candidatus Omnitrophota bacterium]
MIKQLDTSVRYLSGIGPKRAGQFCLLGINTIEDLLYYFPRRYEDRANFTPISRLQDGLAQTIKATVVARGAHQSFRRRGFNIIEIAVSDATGSIFCVWFNQPYLKEYFKVGVELALYGKVEHYSGRLQMSAPEFEIISGKEEEPLNVGRIVPVYSLPQRMTQRYLRQIIKTALDESLTHLTDFLPYPVRSRNNLLNLAQSLLNIHFPQSFLLQKQAYQRLAFDEFFLFQLPLAIRKRHKQQAKGINHKIEGDLVKDFIVQLPFKFTAAQEKVIQEIKLDMAMPNPMRRLLQGDVGSGKTVVATVAALIAAQGGYQAAFMAPTEILARQHYEKIGLQSTASISPQKVRIGLLTGSLNKKDKESLLRQLKEQEIDLLIGTHALLEEKVEFKNLGLVVIDEQHKFGVGQRALLPQKGLNPDVLIMTATPIPRTLAITLYGDLDISVINELPPGRQIVKTLCFTEAERAKVYQFAKTQLNQLRQVFIVYPVIEESYAMDIAGAKKSYSQLKENEFKGYRLGLIHGRMKQKEQEEIMRKFVGRELDMLVSTTVLEVGIDIPNATCMIIEHAERFGLSQLHQLRGRVGRGAGQSFCILVSSAQSQEAAARMEAMVRYSDGFRISEEDLKIRGPGEFFGARQHGLTELKIGNPLVQMQLLKKAREEALKLISQDPLLQARPNTLLRDKLLRRFPEYQNLIIAA